MCSAPIEQKGLFDPIHFFIKYFLMHSNGANNEYFPRFFIVIPNLQNHSSRDR